MPAQPTRDQAPDRQAKIEAQIKAAQQKMTETQERLERLRKELEAEKQRKALEASKQRKRKYDVYMKGTDPSNNSKGLSDEVREILHRFHANEVQWKKRLLEYASIVEILEELKAAQDSITCFHRISMGEVDALKEVQTYVKADRMMLNTLAAPLLPSIRKKISELRDKVCGKKPTMENETKPFPVPEAYLGGAYTDRKPK